MSYLDFFIQQAQASFNSFTDKIDFPAFCTIYAIILIILIRKLNKDTAFRPKNKELMSFKQKVKKSISTFFVQLPIIKSIVQNKFNKKMAEAEIQIIKDLDKNRDTNRTKKLPVQGMKKENIQHKVKKWYEIQQKNMFTGKMSGTIYADNPKYCQQINDFAAKYMYHNPLHLDTYKQLGKMQAQVLKMTSSIISKNKTYGVITSGGSQSLIMSLYAYKTHGNKQRPNIVVPQSIHAAIDKGAGYFNIQLRKAKLRDNFQVDVSHMVSLIDSNTIALYASYPNYPHGIIDPIDDIAKVAKKYKIPFHVDGCLGGFVAGFLKEHENKFTLDIEGVTSISLDHHKFGLAPKGVSTIYFKDQQMRHKMYFIYTDWCGGLYATPSFPGSRSGFASAGAWYSLTHNCKKLFVENAIAITDATKSAAQKLRNIEGVKVFGEPNLCVIAFTTTNVDCYKVKDYIKKKKDWHVSPIHIPKGLHVSITPANYESVGKSLAEDVQEAIQYLKRTNDTSQSISGAIYGASTTLPSNDLGDRLLQRVCSIWYK